MLETLITSKTRVKLMLKFFLNPALKSYLRMLESEFGESSNAIRVELNKFEEAGMLTSEMSGNKKVFAANQNHPMFKDIHNLVRKYAGVDQIVERIAKKVGNLEAVYLSGALANGLQAGFIDIIMVGESLEMAYLTSLVTKVEEVLNKKLKLTIIHPNDFNAAAYKVTPLLIWHRG